MQQSLTTPLQTIPLWFAALVLTVLAGCTTAPARMPISTADAALNKTRWSTDLGSERAIDQRWWQTFADPTLDDLMHRAVGGNLNLQILSARADAAQAQIGQAQASLLPIINFGGRTDTSNISGLGDSPTTTKYGTGGDLLWELDVWGKARKGIEAQKSAYQASVADWQAGYLTMAKSVANAYFQLRQTDKQVLRQKQAIERATAVLSIYERMFTQGLVAQTQVTQQEAELNQLQAQLLDLQRVRNLALNSIATLIGEAPGNLDLDNTAELPAPEAVPVPAGLPAEILARRPDVVAAQLRLLQAVALEQQARLAQLPTVGLTGIGGSASYGLGNLLKTWTSGLSSVVQFPVFNPATRARIPVSEAQTKVAEAQYRASVMAAFAEVENLLTNLASRRQQQVEYNTRRDKLRAVRRQMESQLRLGLVSQLQVLESERSLLSAEQTALNNQWQILNDTVALFAAVGGGWNPQSSTDS